MDKAASEIIPRLPSEIGRKLKLCSFENLQEIRFRIMRPVMLYYSDGVSFLEEAVATEQIISKTIANFCANSVYAYKEEIREGFITIPGGHRIGIGGRAVNIGGDISNISCFSSVNIRIAREYKGTAEKCIPYITYNEGLLNTVIISPPNGGKTTMLRDIARLISEKNKVTVIDERFEIAAEERGIPAFDIGLQTDVLSGFSKSAGIIRALRSLSPDVIICDEIGTHEDVKAVENLLKGGCKIITSMHGESIEQALSKRAQLMSLFDVAVLLGRKNGIPEVIKCQRLWECYC